MHIVVNGAYTLLRESVMVSDDSTLRKCIHYNTTRSPSHPPMEEKLLSFYIFLLMAIKKDPAVLQGMAAVFGNREVDFGKPGIFRPIEFRKLMMDKDYIWKLEVVLKGRVDEVEMQYDVSIILDPTSYNEQIDHLWNEANSAQMKMESI